MRLTAKLKQWAINNTDIQATADDDDFRLVIGEALVSGDLSNQKFSELSTTKDDDNANVFQGQLASLTSGIDALIKAIESDDEGEKADKPSDDDDDKADDVVCPKCEGKMTKTEDHYSCAKCGYKMGEDMKPFGKNDDDHGTKGADPSGTKGSKKPMGWMEKAFASFGGYSELEEDNEKEFNVRIKEAVEMYDGTKEVLCYPTHTEKGKPHTWAGQPVKDFTEDGSHTLYNPSERDKAVAGAFAMFEIARDQFKSRHIALQRMNTHAKQLLMWAIENEKWGGSSNGSNYADIEGRKLTLTEQKALIDDATSGGLEAAPIVFDDQVIQTPLLHGELYPLVNTVPLDRGRRVEGVVTGTVTSSWGGVDDTAITLFTTTSYVSAFDNTIFRWEGAIRIGLDFLSDTPIDFGRHVTAQYGERLLEDLDDVIATGDGTTQPEGVINKSGVGSVSFSGSTTIGAYESLRFGVAKPEHRSNLLRSAVFCGTETSYQRARAIPVGASDARRLGGMDYSSYRWMERDYKINESLSNQQIFYAILARYRMYRRRGLYMRTTTEGDTLIRRNEMLIVAMARYGGALERGAVAAVATDAPA